METQDYANDSSVLRPLSAKQERKLVDYLEEQLLDITRNYKKRLVFWLEAPLAES